MFVSFAEGAGENCHKCCGKAVELSPSNPEAHQLMASCLLSQGKQDEAKLSLMRGISLWLPSKVSGASSSSAEGVSNDIESAESCFPPYFSRINTAKLLLEVNEYDVSAIILYANLYRNYNNIAITIPCGIIILWLTIIINYLTSLRAPCMYKW